MIIPKLLLQTSNNHEFNLIKLSEVNSTNDYAKEIIKNIGQNEYNIVQADYQTNGKGNAGNYWESEAGMNLTFSIIFQPLFLKPEDQFQLNKTISLGILDFVNSIIKNESVKIKWPNDIYINNKKLAGTLIENIIIGNSIEFSICGIGININQKLFKSNAPNPISLIDFTKKSLNLESNLLKLLDCILDRYEALKGYNINKIDTEYFQSLYQANDFKPYFFQNEKIIASIRGVNRYGQLELLTVNKEKIICAFKEIEFIH